MTFKNTYCLFTWDVLALDRRTRGLAFTRWGVFMNTHIISLASYIGCSSSPVCLVLNVSRVKALFSVTPHFDIFS